MGIKRKKLSVGDLVVYTQNSFDYPHGVDMGVGIITDINGMVTVYWPRLWGRNEAGLSHHHGFSLRKIVYREET